MDDLLSQDEINALLSGGALGEDSGSGLSMEDSQLLDEVASIFSNAENSVFGMLIKNLKILEGYIHMKNFLKATSLYADGR